MHKELYGSREIGGFEIDIEDRIFSYKEIR